MSPKLKAIEGVTALGPFCPRGMSRACDGRAISITIASLEHSIPFLISGNLGMSTSPP
jgi:hypothetical protein